MFAAILVVLATIRLTLCSNLSFKPAITALGLSQGRTYPKALSLDVRLLYSNVLFHENNDFCPGYIGEMYWNNEDYHRR